MADVERIGSAVGESVPPASEKALRLRMRGLYAVFYDVFAARAELEPKPGVNFRGESYEANDAIRYRWSNVKTDNAGVGKIHRGGWT